MIVEILLCLSLYAVRCSHERLAERGVSVDVAGDFLDRQFGFMGQSQLRQQFCLDVGNNLDKAIPFTQSRCSCFGWYSTGPNGGIVNRLNCYNLLQSFFHKIALVPRRKIR